VSPDRQRVEALFDEALDLPEAERDAWLAAACGPDGALLAAVRDLLAAHDLPDGLFERAADARAALAALGGAGDPDDVAPEEPEHERIGPYRLLHELGRGGMGVVYLAERADGQFWQRVAVKLVQRGLRDPELRSRFEAERQILAALEHPNIARLIDGGITPDGRPYLVMECVDGLPIDAWCRRHALGLEDRIRLFCTAARAVQHAHRYLVVHRDLKPSNILVTERGQVKLVDFGIAKILDPGRLRLDVPDTRTGMRFLTPEYASPEQVTGRPVTTASDVYALGVVLYELLTGVRPLRLAGLSAAEAERVVQGVDPAPPSAAAGAGLPEAAGRARRLHGDLDRIVLMSLRKEPERRYSSAEALAEDLERCLDGKPVRAAKDGRRYRARKFIRRHALLVAAGLAVVVSLASGLAAALWQADRAGRDRDRAEAALAETRDVNDFLVELFGTEESDTRPIDSTAARALLERGLARVGELSSRPAVEARLLEAMGLMYRELGDRDRADSLLRRSLSLRRASFGDRHEETASASQALGLVARGRGRFEESVEHFQAAWEILRDALGPEHPRTTAALYQLGGALVYVGRREDAERAHREVLAIRRRSLPPDDPGIAEALEVVAAAARRASNYDEAIELLEEALEIRRRALGPDDPEIARTLVLIGDIYFIHMARFAEAEPYFREAIEVHRRRGAPPGWSLTHALGSYAYFLSHTGDTAGPDTLYPQIISMLSSTFGPEDRRTIAETEFHAGHLFRTGRVREARDVLLRTVGIRSRRVPPDHPSMGGPYLALAEVHLALGDMDATERYARLSRNAWLSGREGVPTVGSAKADAFLARARIARGETGEARRLLESAEGTVMDVHGRPHEDLVPIYEAFADLHLALGDGDEAARYREMAEVLRP
jgi:eukaryotic-like serine/threonine-protein kinase